MEHEYLHELCKIKLKEDKESNWETKEEKSLFGKISKERAEYVRCYPYVGDDGIYAPCQEYVLDYCNPTYKLVISKEMFVEAYNKWIKGDPNE